MRFFNTTSTVLACAAIVVASLLTHHTDIERAKGFSSTEAETGKSSGMGPNELFLLDRNYPNTHVNTDRYQQLLRQAKAYDRQQAIAGRDLDHPWQLEGPGNIGGRVNAVAVHPTNPDILLLGYSQGGIWRTDDGGQNWIPVFDEQAGLSISSIIFDPHDPTHLWTATGDVNISGYYWLGTGVYESNDTGLTWQYKGLSDVGILSKIAVDPNDDEIIYVGSMGFPAQKGNQRGLFRSTNGGNSWEKVLTIDDSTGIVDLVTDPITPGRVFASAWTRIRSNTKGLTTGPGTGLYRSDDYGANWINVTTGLPDGVHSRTGVEITNDGTLFLSYVGDAESFDCGSIREDVRNIYKSMDGGLSWDTVPASPFHGLPCTALGGFGWYFEYFKVNPDDPKDMFVLGVSMYRSFDGGMNWFESTPEFWLVHADKHDLVFAHDQIYLGTDGGAYSQDLAGLDQWTDIELIPSTQFYRTEWNPHTPDQYYGGAQDNGTSGGNAAIFNEWFPLFGGDGFQPRFDPDEPAWRYVLTQNGNVWFSTDSGFDFNWLGVGLQGMRYWDMPLLMDAFNPKILYCGSDRVFRINMEDSVRQWNAISEDLTRGDSILNSRYPALTALAQSEIDSLRLYAGTQDGLVWTSADGGMNWENITEGTPGFFVTSITCSTINPEGVFATYSGYRDNDHLPYIYRSDDAGKNWTAIQSNLPMMGVNDLFIIPGSDDLMLIAGTDGGVYASIDGDSSWYRAGNNMPYMPVYDIDFNPMENKIIAATFSRGIMTFPVEELELPVSNNQPTTALKGISVFPTVFQSELTIDLTNVQLFTGSIDIEVLSISGEVVFSEKVENSVQRKHLTLPHAMLPGMYLIRVLHNSKESAVFKVVKS